MARPFQSRVSGMTTCLLCIAKQPGGMTTVIGMTTARRPDLEWYDHLDCAAPGDQLTLSRKAQVV